MMICRRCNVEMRPGKVLLETYTTGEPDFPGDKTGITISRGGPGEVVDCWKCPNCGRSVTKENE